MTSSMDIRSLMLPHVLEATPYAGVEPPDVLAREAGIPEDQVVKLDGNENLYGPAPGVAEALAAYDGYHIYPDPMQRRVRETLAAYAGTTPDRVVAGVGSDELIDLLLRLFVGPGESVIQCSPTFGMYAAFTQLIGGTLVSVPRDETFDVPVDAVRQATGDGAKLLFLASPNNPTGNLVDEATVRQLLALGIVVVVDEAYYEFSGATLARLVPENPNLVVLRTFSKWAGLAGLRLGYGIMDPLVAERMLTIKPPYNITVASETALLASLGELDLLMSRVKAIVQERDKLFLRLQAIEGVVPVPSSANFILCRLPEGQGNRVYSELARRGVFVRYYDAPPLQDCIRVSVGLPFHSQRLVEALIEILS